MVPSLHKRYLSVIVDRVFCRCAERLVEKLQPDALNGTAVNMEDKFSQLTLDVIGLSVFNYDFDSVNADSPVIGAVYTALKEAEARSTDLLPYWKASSFLSPIHNMGLLSVFIKPYFYSPVLEFCRLNFSVR